MAGQAGRVILLAVAGATSVGAGPSSPDPVRSLAGGYHDQADHAEIIPIDRDHAYVHIWLVGGDTRICEFEEVMAAERDHLEYSGTNETDGQCALSVRRRGRALSWSEPSLSTCQRWCGVNDYLHDGGLPWSSRRSVRRSFATSGEGTMGYADTVAAWRAGKAR